MATPNKKKRDVITLSEKKSIIEALGGKSLSELSVQFNLPKSTVKRILDDKESINNAIDRGNEAKRARFTPVKNENLEEAVLRWVKAVRSQNIPLTGSLLTEKAKELAKKLAKQLRKVAEDEPLAAKQAKMEEKAAELESFQASDGWLSRFKHRHSIIFRSNQGEAADIDLGALNDWKKDILLEAISHFSADDVFHADETGLFWQLLPNKTLAFKGERCTSGKKSKERITVLVGSNMSGTEKLPLLVIGKSTNPRCFKNARVPVNYKANKKAWMTADLFEAWLREWDRKLKQDKRKVLLFLDNFSGHSKIKLEQITLKFFPPNTTAESQPMDQGIIQNLKVHYRRFLLSERIAAIDTNTDFKINLLKALCLLHRAWRYVRPETLANCFLKAGFIVDGQPLVAQNDAEEEMNTLWEELQPVEPTECDLLDYLNVDQDVVTGGTLRLEEIAEAVSTAEAEYDSDSGEVIIDEEEPVQPAVTTREAIEGFKLFQRYVETNFADPAVLGMCDKLDVLLTNERLKKMKQKNLFDYFTANK